MCSWAHVGWWGTERHDESAWLHHVAVSRMPVSLNVVDRLCHMALISPCGAGRVLVSPPTTSQVLAAKEAGALTPEEANLPSKATVRTVGRLTIDALNVSDDLAARVANIQALSQASRAATQGGSKPDAFPEATQSGCSSLGAQAQGLASMQAAKARALASRQAKVKDRQAVAQPMCAAFRAVSPPSWCSSFYSRGSCGLQTALGFPPFSSIALSLL